MSIVLLCCILIMLLRLPLVINGIVVFIFGGCVGGLNILAVLDAGQKVKDNQVSSAMMLVALAYTFGSIIGPICAGWSVSYFDKQGLLYMSAVGAFIFILFLILNRFRFNNRQV